MYIFGGIGLRYRRSLLLWLTICTAVRGYAQAYPDTGKILQKVTISANKQSNDFSNVVPVQTLNHEKLGLINSISDSDVA